MMPLFDDTELRRAYQAFGDALAAAGKAAQLIVEKWGERLAPVWRTFYELLGGDAAREPYRQPRRMCRKRRQMAVVARRKELGQDVLTGKIAGLYRDRNDAQRYTRYAYGLSAALPPTRFVSKRDVRRRARRERSESRAGRRLVQGFMQEFFAYAVPMLAQ